VLVNQQVVSVEIPKERIQFYVASDEEVLDLGADDMIIIPGLPNCRPFVDALVMGSASDSRFE
jgi:hypothetical protein